jgi:hypothetical protein
LSGAVERILSETKDLSITSRPHYLPPP